MSWFSRLPDWLKHFLARDADDDDPATEEFATLSSFTLLPGQLKLRVGVVSVRGNYREHNEDNFYVPGRRSVRHDSGSESNSEMPALTLEPSNLFIVADGMGGQQAGEQASLMAVELIPRAIARRLSARGEGAQPDQGSDPRRGRRGQSRDPGQLRSGHRVLQHGDDGGARPVSVRPGVRGRHRRLACLPPPRRPARTAHQGPLAGRRPARRRHDHGRRAADHKFKNVLYLYLGSKDARGGPEDVRVLDVRPGDRLLMASDGLTGVVPDKDLARVLGTVDDPQQAAVDPQEPGSGERFQGQRHLPDHPCRRAARRSRSAAS